MKNIQAITDKTAISLSLLCTIHCLVLPLAAIMLPSFTALQLENEAFHLWMVIAVIPISIYALTMGCKRHKRYQVVLLGALGLFILGIAAFWGEQTLGEAWEKTLTVVGAGILIVGHFRNYRLCRRHNACECA